MSSVTLNPQLPRLIYTEDYSEKNPSRGRVDNIFRQKVTALEFPEISSLETILYSDDLSRIDLPKISPDFIEREELLFHLKKDVIQDQWNMMNYTIVKILYGIAGIGKTDLAVAFGHKNRNCFSLIWFIPCGARGLYEKSYRELAEVLNISHQNKSISDLVAEVHAILENDVDRKKPWLLIFDNVCEMQKIDRLPQFGGCILMTTQHLTIWNNQNDYMEIPPFCYQEAEKLLKQIGNSKASDQMKTLIDELGGYPILINAAGRSIGSYESLDEYLSLIRSQEASFWNIKQATRYPKVIGPVFYLLFEQIKKKSPLAFEFLELLAFLNPDYISVDFFEFWLNEKNATVQKNNILKTLTGQGMIRFDEVKKTFSIHRLQQQVIQASSKEEKYNEVIAYLAKWSKGFSVDEPNTSKIGIECFLQIGRRSDDPFWRKNIDHRNRVQILSVCESWMGKIIGNEILALDIQLKERAIQDESKTETVNEGPQVESTREKLIKLNNNANGWPSGLTIMFGGAFVLATLAASYFYSKSKE